MNEHFPSLERLDDLPRRVLCVATHPGDHVRACGALLALHAERGDDVSVLVLADGPSATAAGPRSAGAEAEQNLRAERESESRAAAAALGVEAVEFLGLSEGSLGGTFELVERLKERILVAEPEVVYAPSPLEPHPDHRAASAALAAALASLRPVRALLYGIHRQVPANTLFDVSAGAQRKRAALERLSEREDRDTEAFDRSYALHVDDPDVERVEGFVELRSDRMRTFVERAAALADTLLERSTPGIRDRATGLPRTTAVISTWNKRDDVRANLEGLRAQTRPFAQVIVVDNASSDGTAEMIAEEFPDVRLIVMPHSAYGACETFNIGFASSKSELTAILDDDVVLPPEWLEKATQRLTAEPSTTAVVSTKIVEPGMPESFRSSPEVNRERYMSTFRGCASLARTSALTEAGGYDERLFIYGNERDLTCRLLNLGYRVLQYPGVEAFHKTPFGIKMGKRSLYYHARNAWLAMLKYAPLSDLMRMPFLVLSRVLLRSSSKESKGAVTDATGTIGIGRSVRETPGALWVLTKAACSVLANVPYCLKRRRPVRAPDFELPID